MRIVIDVQNDNVVSVSKEEDKVVDSYQYEVLCCRIEKEIKLALKEKAATNKQTVSSLVREIIIDHFTKQEE